MAIVGASVPTLVDITKRLDPNGKVADIAELLTQEDGRIRRRAYSAIAQNTHPAIRRSQRVSSG